MTRFTAFTTVLSRWLTKGVIGGIVLWIWSLGMIWVGHHVIEHPGCDGSLFYDASHLVTVLLATLWASIAALALWGIWMVLEEFGRSFWKAVVHERHPPRSRR